MIKQIHNYEVYLTGQVFEAEKQVTKTGVIHKYCLACNNCNCNLDASSFFNGDDGEVELMRISFETHTFTSNTEKPFIYDSLKLSLVYIECIQKYHLIEITNYSQLVIAFIGK